MCWIRNVLACSCKGIKKKKINFSISENQYSLEYPGDDLHNFSVTTSSEATAILRLHNLPIETRSSSSKVTLDSVKTMSSQPRPTSCFFLSLFESLKKKKSAFSSTAAAAVAVASIFNVRGNSSSGETRRVTGADGRLQITFKFTY